MEIIEAVLHRIDEDGKIYYANNALDLTDATIDFITGHIGKVKRSVETKTARFEEVSDVFKLVKNLKNREIFIQEFSKTVCERMGYLVREYSEVPGGGFLVAHYTEKEEEFLFLCKLPYQSGFLHENDNSVTKIKKEDKLLPSFRTKIKEAVIIPFSPMVLQVLEESVKIEDEWTLYFSRFFLGATGELSQKEVVDQLLEIHEEMANELSEKPFDVNCSMAKWGHTVLMDSFENEEHISVHSIASRLFPENDQHKTEYLDSARMRGIKEDIPVQKSLLTRSFARQVFETSKGIQIRLPSEMVDDDSQVEFVHHENGSVTIMLKNLREKME